MILTSMFGNYASDLKQIYKKRDDGYQKLECYLPGAVGTLREPIIETAKKWLFQFEVGVRKASNIGVTKFIIVDGDFVADGKFEKQS